jgi:hypothetical protein
MGTLRSSIATPRRLPSAALLDEIGRCTDATKHAYTDGVLVIVDDIAARLAPRRSAFRLSVARGTASHNHGADGDVTSLQLRRQIILGYAQDGCKGRFSPVITRRTDA